MGLWFTGRAGGSGVGGGGVLPVGTDTQTLRWNQAILQWVANSILTNDGTDLFSLNLMKFGTVGNPPTHNVHAEGASPGFFERTSADTVSQRTPVALSHKTSGNMADNFGVLLQYFIEDNAAVINLSSQIATLRDGADNTSRQLLSAVLAGVAALNMGLETNGSVTLGDTTIDASTQPDLPFSNGYVIKSGAFDASILSDTLLADRNYNYPNYPGQIDIHNPRFSTGKFSDFGEDSPDKTGWDMTLVGANSKFDATSQNIGTNNDGVFRAETGTTATGLAMAAYGDDQTGFKLGGGVRFWECLILIGDLATVAQDYIMRFGFGDEIDGTEYSEGVWLEYNISVGVNWLRKTAVGGSVTSEDTGIVVVEDSYIRLRGQMDAAGGIASYFINGSAEGSINTDMPIDLISPNIHILKTAGITNRDFFIDYYDQRVIYTTPR